MTFNEWVEGSNLFLYFLIWNFHEFRAITELYDIDVIDIWYLVFHQLWLKMEHHERASARINGPPYSEAWIFLELALGCEEHSGNKSGLGFKPSALPSSYTAFPVD